MNIDKNPWGRLPVLLMGASACFAYGGVCLFCLWGRPLFLQIMKIRGNQLRSTKVHEHRQTFY